MGSTLFCLGMLVVALSRVGVLDTAWEAPLLSLNSVVGWTYMLFFLLAHQSSGPIVIIIYKMFVSDVLLFMTIYGVFLLGFAQAFYVQFNDNSLADFMKRVKACFSTMLGDLDFESFSDQAQVSNPFLATLLLTVYVVIISVVLLNLLIAMMGDTYAKIIDESRMIWQLEQARILFSLETELTDKEREEETKSYQVIIKGKPHVQVFLIDEDHFGGESDEWHGSDRVPWYKRGFWLPGHQDIPWKNSSREGDLYNVLAWLDDRGLSQTEPGELAEETGPEPLGQIRMEHSGPRGAISKVADKHHLEPQSVAEETRGQQTPHIILSSATEEGLFTGHSPQQQSGAAAGLIGTVLEQQRAISELMAKNRELAQMNERLQFSAAEIARSSLAERIEQENANISLTSMNRELLALTKELTTAVGSQQQGEVPNLVR